MNRNALVALGTLAALALPVTTAAQQAPPVTPSTGVFADANNSFAVDLYTQLRAQAGNLIFSPASVSAAMAMTHAGAVGSTAAEMARTLHFDADVTRMHTDFAAQLRAWNAPRTSYEFNVVNRLWGEQTYHFLPGFLTVAREQFGAALQPLDFRHAFSVARTTINRWVAAQTRQHIVDLLPVETVNADTRLILTNAVYFHGAWEHAFPASATHDAPFHGLGGTATQVPMMHTAETVQIGGADGVHVLELPYRGGEVALDVILPDAQDGLAAVESNLTAAHLRQWLSGLQSMMAAVSLPRFTGASSLDLLPPLHALGIHDAFDRQRADLSGMAPLDPAQRLYISAVVHKAFVQLNEEGTVATAAIAVVVAAPPSAPAQPVVFNADHPFLYVIRDTRSGAILFMGRVVSL